MRIFYSWQSDRAQNRRFIREAAEAAATALANENNFDDAARPGPDIQIDQDTTNVPGSPPIAETILAKIASADAFLADLTFIGDLGHRKVPNPNVLIELGYALAKPGGSVVVCVMNAAYGEPSDLPFDLAHRRWPIRFNLPDGASKEARSSALNELQSSLQVAFASILKAQPGEPKAEPTPFIAQPPADAAGLLRAYSEPLCHHGEKADAVFMRSGPYAFLRLIPTTLQPELSHVEAAAIVRAKLFTMDAMRAGGGGFVGRHVTGAVTYWCQSDDFAKAWSASEVFRTRELWAVNAQILSNAAHKEPGIRYIPTVPVEGDFVDCLVNFLNVAFLDLGIVPPVRIIAGLANVSGMHLAVDFTKFGGHYLGPLLQQHVIYEGVINDPKVDAEAFLLPFFKQIYDAAGYTRPDSKIPRRRRSLL